MENKLTKTFIYGEYIVSLLHDVAKEKGYKLSTVSAIRIMDSILEHEHVTKELVEEIIDKEVNSN